MVSGARDVRDTSRTRRQSLLASASSLPLPTVEA